MSADIYIFPTVPVERRDDAAAPGNGAREALIEIGKNCPFHMQDDVVIYWADDLLAALRAVGFKVVPIPSEETP